MEHSEQVKAILKYVSGPDGRRNLWFKGELVSGSLFFASPTMPGWELVVAKLAE